MSAFHQEVTAQTSHSRLSLASARRHNLPAQLTTFVGREALLAGLEQQLGLSRLVTLTGPGGCGKTRLAIQTASGLLHLYPDGVWLAELAPLSDPIQVMHLVASSLALREQVGVPLVQTLQSYLSTRRLLLLLDNCEHLLPGCAELAGDLLKECPQLSILATSREPLGVPGESVWAVPSLTLPDPDAVSDALESEAVRLFLERAIAVQPRFALTPQNAKAIIQICARLDGIPLAIEMAATRIKGLSAEEVANRLNDRFRLLTCGGSMALPRHQTLRATVDWSYHLLSEQERVLWHRLSVFAGEFSLEAAEAVCAGSPVVDVMSLLFQLIDKSIVSVSEHTDETRYTMLETIHQYGLEQLAQSGEAGAMRERFLTWCTTFAEQAEPQLSGHEQQVWLNRVEREYRNLRAALQSCETTDSLSGLRIATAMKAFFLATGRLSEGLAWLKRFSLERVPGWLQLKALLAIGAMTLEHGDSREALALLERALTLSLDLGDRPSRADALLTMGEARERQGEFAAARTCYEEALCAFEGMADKRGTARALINLGALLTDTLGDYAAARPLYVQSLAIMREQGNRLGIATVLHNLGVGAAARGECEQARALYEESLAILKGLDNQWRIATVVNNMAKLAFDQADYGRAVALHKESLRIRLDLDHRTGVAACLPGLAAAAAALGWAEHAARMLGALEAFRETGGITLSSSDQSQLQHCLEIARSQSGKDRFIMLFAQGKTLSLNQLAESALTIPEAPAPPLLPEVAAAGPGVAALRESGLTGREIEVIRLVAAGLTDREIAARLVISRYTVASHLRNIFAKLELPSRSKLAAWAFQNGVATPL